MPLFKINICNKEQVKSTLCSGWGGWCYIWLPHCVLPPAPAFPQNQWMNTHPPTRLKFRGMPSKLTGPNQMSRGLCLMFYKDSREDTSAFKKGVTVLCTKGYCVPTRRRWACKNCQAPYGVVPAPICTLPASPVLIRAWWSGIAQNEDTGTVPRPPCLTWDPEGRRHMVFLAVYLGMRASQAITKPKLEY